MNSLDLFADVVRLRWQILAALQHAPATLLARDMETNHRSILQTLVHVMDVEQSWVREDLAGEAAPSEEEMSVRFLAPGSVQAIIEGWREITAGTVGYLHDHPDLTRQIRVGRKGKERAVTVEQVVYHLAGEEMIHMGEVLAMTRQLGIDLPAYFLLSVMRAADRPWDLLVAGHKAFWPATPADE